MNEVTAYNTTLLADSEIGEHEKSRLDCNDFKSKEALMRGQFGKPLV